MIKMKNSRGEPSSTLGFAVLSWIAGTGVFILAAWKGTYLLAEYGIFLTGTIGTYVFKEKTDKDRNQQ